MLASAEALSPLLGLLVGEITGRMVPERWFRAIAALLLLALGVLLLREAADDDAEGEILERAPLLGALAVGADEFGFGLTLPYLHAYAALPALIIAAQAPLAVGLGLWLGDRGRSLVWLRWVPSIGVLLLAVAAALSAVGVDVPLGLGIVKMIGKA